MTGLRIVSWISTAADTAAVADPKATAKLSPAVAKTYPSRASTMPRMRSSCSASASVIASGCWSQSAVEPTMSVNRNVTSPACGCVMSLRGGLWATSCHAGATAVHVAGLCGNDADGDCHAKDPDRAGEFR